MENMPISIKLTLGQWNLVLNALGHRPFAEVNEVIMAIKAQGEKAVAEAAPMPEAAPVETSEEAVQ